MKSKGTKLLTKLIEQYHQRHHKNPAQIIIDPLALVVLAYRRSTAVTWGGIPVYCQEFEVSAPQGEINTMGVALLDDGIQAVDLSISCATMDSGHVSECSLPSLGSGVKTVPQLPLLRPDSCGKE